MTPQPTAKDWTEDFSHENGNYLCLCVVCKSQFIGHKRRVTCRECAHPSQPAGASETLTKGGDEPCSPLTTLAISNAAPASDPLDAASMADSLRAETNNLTLSQRIEINRKTKERFNPAPSPVPAEAQPEPASEAPMRERVFVKHPTEDWGLYVRQFQPSASAPMLDENEIMIVALHRELASQREATKRAERDRERYRTKMNDVIDQRDSLQAKLTEAEESAKRSIGALTTEFERQMLAIVAERDALTATVAELREDKLDLDWLETQDKKTNLGILYAGARPPIKGGGLQGSTLRATIRDARAK